MWLQTVFDPFDIVAPPTPDSSLLPPPVLSSDQNPASSGSLLSNSNASSLSSLAASTTGTSAPMDTSVEDEGKAKDEAESEAESMLFPNGRAAKKHRRSDSPVMTTLQVSHDNLMLSF